MSRGGNRNPRSRTIALAGLFQAVWLVRLTAHGYLRDPDATRASIRSIFATDADSVTAVFGGIRHLSTGLETMIAQLDTASGQRDLELTSHVISLLHLARQLTRNRTMSEQIAAELRRLCCPADDAGMDDPELIAALATLYQQTISTLSPRVLVHGEPSLLENRDTQNRIRSLLLAGIRAGVLWQQCGGGRWRLLVERGRMLECARALLREIRNGTG